MSKAPGRGKRKRTRKSPEGEGQGQAVAEMVDPEGGTMTGPRARRLQGTTPCPTHLPCRVPSTQPRPVISKCMMLVISPEAPPSQSGCYPCPHGASRNEDRRSPPSGHDLPWLRPIWPCRPSPHLRAGTPSPVRLHLRASSDQKAGHSQDCLESPPRRPPRDQGWEIQWAAGTQQPHGPTGWEAGSGHNRALRSQEGLKLQGLNLPEHC